MANTEKSIESDIKVYLETQRLRGDKVFFYKQFQSGGTMQGLPDIIACINGQFVGIEVKAPNGVISPQQMIVSNLITKANGVFVVCESIQQFVEWYQRYYSTMATISGHAFSLKWFGMN